MNSGILQRLHQQLLPADKKLGYGPYFWLTYLFMLAIGVYWAMRVGVTISLWLTLASVVIFLPLYFRSYWLYDKPIASLLNSGCMALLGVGLMHWNYMSGVYFVFAAAASAFVLSTRALVVYLIVLSVLLFATGWLNDLAWYINLPPLFFTFMVGLDTHRDAQIRQKNREIEESQAEIQHLVKVAERERIGRDLHDVLGHSLSLITLKAELASKLIDRDIEKARTEIQQLESISRETLQQVREAVSGYRNKDIQTEIRQLKQALHDTKVSCDIEQAVVNYMDKLPESQQSVLALCLREAITNIIRHAQASHARLTLQESASISQLILEDNGVGIKLDTNQQIIKGNGLRGMRDRLQSLGGELQIQANQPQGTRLHMILPRRKYLLESQ